MVTRLKICFFIPLFLLVNYNNVVASPPPLKNEKRQFFVKSINDKTSRGDYTPKKRSDKKLIKAESVRNLTKRKNFNQYSLRNEFNLAYKNTVFIEPRFGYSSMANSDGSDNSKLMPIIIVNPYTNGYSKALYNQLLGSVKEITSNFLVVLPGGRWQRKTYNRNFPKFVDYYAEMVEKIVKKAINEHNGDPKRVYMVGYSLGGDVSWAVTLKKPELFAGIVSMGSRNSYVANSLSILKLKRRNFLGVFAIGENDTINRKRGNRNAGLTLEKYGIRSLSFTYPKPHRPPSEIDFKKIIDPILRDAI